MMAMGSHIRGGTVYGAFPGLKQQESDVLGPSGLGIQFDYRSVFSEVLETMDSGHHDRVFPQFQSTRVGFINSTRTS
jgi:uncharacterized protein (DUF1501 family)